MTKDVEPFDSLQELMEAVPILITVYNVVTDKYVYVNHRVKNILGYPPSFFLNKNREFVSSFVHPDDLPRLLQQNDKAIEDVTHRMFWLDTKPIVTLEFRMKRKNGTWCWLHTDRNIYLRDVSGKITHILSASLDITDRKIAEERFKQLNNELEQRVKERTEALAAIEERYQTYLAQSSEGIWRFALDEPMSTKLPIKKQIKMIFEKAYLAECNDAMARMYGFSRAKELINSRLKDFLVPTDKANIEYLTAFIKSGYRLTEAESHEKDKDGNDRYFENNLVGIIKDDYVHHAWGTQKDITERKELEKRKNDFIAIASHELKTPLTSLKLYTEIISAKKEAKNKEYSSLYVQKMTHQINRLASLVNDLLDATKIQEGKLSLQKKWFPLEHVIRDEVGDMQLIYPSHKIRIRGHLSEEVYADKLRLNQVLVNLLVNAIKFSPNKAEIVVTLQEHTDRITVSVKDFGIGISLVDQKKLLGRFFQANTHKRGGLGLGLFISSYIIKQHGGELFIQSEKGKGSTFMFQLPKVKKLKKPISE